MKDQHSLLLAIKLHNGQMRRGGTEPYVCHSIRVADQVHAFDGNPMLYQAAVLHDVVEDTPVTLEELNKIHAIPEYTCTLIDLLSKRDDETRGDYLARLVDSENSDAILIKIMDSLDNATMRVEDFKWYRDNNRNMAKDFQKYIDTANMLLTYLKSSNLDINIIKHNIQFVTNYNRKLLIDSGYNLS